MGRRTRIKDLAYGLLHTFISRYNDLDGYWAVGMLHALQTVGACWPHDPAKARRKAEADWIRFASA